MSAAETPHSRYASFALAPATRAGGVLSNGAFQSHREFLDFIIDGIPLLQRLDDVDAVSPLAADVGPSVLAEQVQRLLLRTGPPAVGGRHIIYACPECADLGCGAVTAVIEPEGEDVVWRDFVWQTDETADQMLNGYPGIGPFRFRGADYRGALERLLLDSETPGTRRRVLLLGKRASVLTRLAAALRQVGIGAEIAADVSGTDPAELRTYGAVAFGRAITAEQRAAVREVFAGAGADAAFVDGLAPVIPLLVAQLEEALDRAPDRLHDFSAAAGALSFSLAEPTAVHLLAYRLDRLYRTHTAELLDAQLDAGEHRFELDSKLMRGESFIVARAAGGVRVAPVQR